MLIFFVVIWMIKQIFAIIKSFQHGNITENEAAARFKAILKTIKQKPTKRDHHDVVVQELTDIHTEETMYQAVCTHCGLSSKWFHEKGLAISNLNRYVCEVD